MTDDAKDPAVTISEKKLEANRRNAQRSTGPRTEAGKKQSRRNALNHGIFASVLLVEGVEDSHAYKKFLQDLRREWNPAGELEELLVEDLATLEWRRRRALQWERRIIRDGFFLRPELIDPQSLPDTGRFDLLLRYQTRPDLESLEHES